MLSSVTVDGKNAFGNTGVQVAHELDNYLQWKQGMVKRGKSKPRRVNEDKGSEESMQARCVVTAYYDLAKEVFGVVPVNFNFGRAVKKTIEAIKKGWNKDDLIHLVRLFFESRDDQPWIFKDGSYEAFMAGLLRLQDLHRNSAPQGGDIVIPREFANG